MANSKESYGSFANGEAAAASARAVSHAHVDDVELRRGRCAVIVEDVRRGLTRQPKTLPPHLFYDDVGSILYERITELPEYYLTRVERSIFEAQGDAIVAAALADAPCTPTLIELGAGSAAKTEILLDAVLTRRANAVYVPIDVSRAALDVATQRLASTLPALTVRPLVATHEAGIASVRGPLDQAVALFIGSSIGNLEDVDAIRLLGALRDLGAQASLVLGADLRKNADVLLRAYDDRAGVTAAFNKNLLTRINRELAGHFDLDTFRHVARWNDGASRIEMHLESVVAQRIAIDALALDVTFDPGETIHTESSVKYTHARLERLLAQSGFDRSCAFHDFDRCFAVYVAHAT